jgi:hypothetical protein
MLQPAQLAALGGKRSFAALCPKVSDAQEAEFAKSWRCNALISEIDPERIIPMQSIDAVQITKLRLLLIYVAVVCSSPESYAGGCRPGIADRGMKWTGAV